MDCSLLGSSVLGILQARMLEWFAISFSRLSSQPGNRTLVSCLLHWQVGSFPLVPHGKPKGPYTCSNIVFLKDMLGHFKKENKLVINFKIYNI